MSIAATGELMLPRADGSLERFVPSDPPSFDPREPLRSRVFIAAAHVVADPLAAGESAGGARLGRDPGLPPPPLELRAGRGHGHRPARHGPRVGRGARADRSLGRSRTRERRSARGRCGHRPAPPGRHSLARIRDAYLEQCEFVEEQGCQAILMASRALAAAAETPGDYRRVLDPVLRHAEGPLILHWLGEMFDPALAGYWGAADPYTALHVVTELIGEHAERIDGIKLSLLDDELELRLRDALPEAVRVYTGDDFNFPSLIASGSDALLGVFDAIAPAASAALQALDRDDRDRYDALLAPALPLARKLFAAPTYHYKTGIVLLAWLNGHQHHFRMVAGAESARTLVHLAELVRLADAAGLLRDPGLAVQRMGDLLALAGVRR